MNLDTALNQKNEKTLIDIIRTLPPNRVEQLVDFARFLEAQLLNESLLQGEDSAEVEADNAQWDQLLASDESQSLLNQMANEALAAHRAGKTKPMTVTENGRITPG